MAILGHDDWSIAQQGLTDEDAVNRARRGDARASDCLFQRYRWLVEKQARSYFVAGAEQDDVFQEGMMGLWKAIQDFRSDRLPRFAPFAELCVTRQIITAVKAATRQKHGPLNGYVSLDKPMSDDGHTVSLVDVIADKATSPEELLFEEPEEEPKLYELHGELSELELRVVERYLESRSYHEIAEELACGTKSVDNALQRAKRKIKKLRQ